MNSRQTQLDKIKLTHSSSNKTLSSSQAQDRANSNRLLSSNRIVELHSISIKLQ